MDGLDLFVQIVLALALLHLLLDAPADATIHSPSVDFRIEQADHALHPLLQVEGLQHRLLGIELERRERRDGVGQPRRIVDAQSGRQHILRDLLGGLGKALEARQQRLERGLGKGSRRLRLVHLGDIRHEVVAICDKVLDLGAAASFDQHLYLAVGQGEELQYGSYRAHLEQVVAAGIGHFGIASCHQQDALVAGDGSLQGADGAIGAHEQRMDAARIDDHLAQGENGKRHEARLGSTLDCPLPQVPHG